MMNKHTPGPWEYAGAHVGRTPYGEIAETYGQDFEANARIIAAAPEMLEALQFAVDELQLCSDEQEGRFGKTLDKLLAVIDKAKGEHHA